LAKIKIYFQYFVNTFLKNRRETFLPARDGAESSENSSVARVITTFSRQIISRFRRAAFFSRLEKLISCLETLISAEVMLISPVEL
jgi:hypothetical protein